MKKQVNRLTGETRFVVSGLRKVDYEFECEALADFKYSIDPSKTNAEAE